MFIFWGENSRYETHGVVGDVCPVCVRVRAFTVHDVFSSSHIYGFSLGSGSFQARIKQCWGCGTDFRARVRDYDGFVDEERAESLSLRGIVERTNSALADWMEDNPQSDVREFVPDREPAPGNNSSRDNRTETRGYSSDRRPKYDYQNRRILAVLTIIFALLGAGVFGFMAYVQYLDWEKYGSGPTEISAADLVERGPGEARFVRVTGMQVGSEYWQDGGKQGGSLVHWLVAAPVEDPSLELPKNVPPARLFILRLNEREDSERIYEIARTGEFTGLVALADPPPSFEAKRFFERRYPGSDIGQAWVVKQYKAPELNVIYALAGLSAFCAVVVLGALAYYLKLRRAERSTPPALAN